MTEITAHHGLFKDTNLHVDDAGGNVSHADEWNRALVEFLAR